MCLKPLNLKMKRKKKRKKQKAHLQNKQTLEGPVALSVAQIINVNCSETLVSRSHDLADTGALDLVPHTSGSSQIRGRCGHCCYSS